MDTVDNICDGLDTPVAPTEEESAQAAVIVRAVLAGGEPITPASDGEAYALRDQLAAALPDPLDDETSERLGNYVKHLADHRHFEMATLVLQSLVRASQAVSQSKWFLQLVVTTELGDLIAGSKTEEP